jgi:hypothetical protein
MKILYGYFTALMAIVGSFSSPLITASAQSNQPNASGTITQRESDGQTYTTEVFGQIIPSDDRLLSNSFMQARGRHVQTIYGVNLQSSSQEVVWSEKITEIGDGSIKLATM